MQTLLPDLRNQVAIVTGAGRGIGRAIARGLAACGAHVVAAARTRSQLDALVDEIRAAGGSAAAAPADAGDPESLMALFKRLDAEHGGRLDILINNAGIGIYGPIVDFRDEDFDRLYAVNLRGTLIACREALRRMAALRRGTIINISSVVGLKGYERQGAYTATKHGIVGLTKSLAIEAQKLGVRASVICPGGVDTELAAAARPDLDRSSLMQPEDIARTVLFLLGLPERAAIDCIYIRRASSAPW